MLADPLTQPDVHDADDCFTPRAQRERDAVARCDTD
jgi:hypothetical protein